MASGEVVLCSSAGPEGARAEGCLLTPPSTTGQGAHLRGQSEWQSIRAQAGIMGGHLYAIIC